MLKPLYLREDDTLLMLDQRKLPLEEVWLEIKTVEEVSEAIKTLTVRGAPAIGIAAAYGFYLGAKGYENASREEFRNRCRYLTELLASTRPTAVNLFWALKRMNQVAQDEVSPVSKIIKKLRAEAIRIQEEDLSACFSMAEYGAKLVPEKGRILTHCNAGAIATAGYGTALGVIRKAWEQGKIDMVWVDETRPLLQGARLTAWELEKEEIPYRVICDNMAGYVMSKGLVDMVIVGADRITSRGDVANKIGTYSLAVIAKHHGIPFMVVAPTSTIDISLESGDSIPIEERKEEEVLSCRDVRITPKGARAFNPAFDVTPAELVTYIVTEKGVAQKPFCENLKSIINNAD
ncbi:methylthioribose-1-phosphate isomerase [Thermosulfidibacter takaii ABI70S6]|uniref:Methylthioribose-1-phosphate isomerase n=1 Tax=Thermosulfidibacter takaii (strain DSM 17441 / JCM 13301 / NBRC 103674 / ABI70S6) TaxID=1298851 RepID=A0A0S3QSI4_THET7|nr:S-methyl-5-thioribose-1-phosphate isomerase [Thermosulfidibacter takaii]BAT71285.1 methylthioribose-1-phosphate isomerase [Thermosulfidibacter takaii ABI70S6]